MGIYHADETFAFLDGGSSLASSSLASSIARSNLDQSIARSNLDQLFKAYMQALNTFLAANPIATKEDVARALEASASRFRTKDTVEAAKASSVDLQSMLQSFAESISAEISKGLASGFAEIAALLKPCKKAEEPVEIKVDNKKGDK